MNNNEQRTTNNEQNTIATPAILSAAQRNVSLLVTVHGHVDGPELSRFGVAIFPGHMAVQGLGT